ncbi:MAG: DUF3052 domain-containing protein [Sporichthyaceae bacterium]
MTATSNPAGYSGTPLPQKLGIKAGHRVLLVGAPDGADLGPLPDGDLHRRAGRTPYDVVLLFCTDLRRLEQRFAPLAARLVPNGGLWVAWPKRSSGVSTDLDENSIRAVGLSAGLVDNKVCAIDATWSGLRFVIRLRDR